MNRTKIGLILFSFVLSLVPAIASAGTLTLKNGDRVQGDLVVLRGANVVWASESFGELTIAKSLVAGMETETLFKMTGNDNPCTLLAMDDINIPYSCADGAVGSVSLLTVEDLQPYEEFHVAGWEYTGKALISGSYDRGNKVQDELDGDFDMKWRKGDWRHRLIGDYDSDSIDNEAAVEIYRLSYGGKWFFADKWYAYDEAFAGVDDSKNIVEQYGLGAGLGYQVWETDITALSFEGGIITIKENLDKPDDWMEGDEFEGRNDRTSWKLGSDYVYNFSFGSFFNRNNYVQAFNETSNWQLETNTGLSFPLMEVLTGEVKFEYDVDNQPGEGNRREDKKLSFGVGYSW